MKYVQRGMIIMLLTICDIFTTILQATLIAWACNNIASKENKISKFKSWFLVSINSALIIGFTYSNIHVQYANFIIEFSPLLMCIIFYRKSIMDGVIGFGIVYATIVIVSYLLIAFYKQVIVKMDFRVSNDWQMFFFIFIPVWLMYSTLFIFRKKIFNAVLYMKTYTI